MTNLTPESYTIGYCTNVHAGVDLPAIEDNLERYAVPVRSAAVGQGELGVGLWLPSAAVEQLAVGDQAAQFGQFLAERKLRAYTINGFPYDNFH
ncbi:MAG: xylose isomerase, partial [Pirellulales bacterium]|nr:xylose isomerase [Pirellulales bacterium]